MQLPVENYGEDREPLPGFNSSAILSAYADDVIVFFKRPNRCRCSFKCYKEILCRVGYAGELGEE